MGPLGRALMLTVSMFLSEGAVEFKLKGHLSARGMGLRAVV
jgi:hypothetical protein